MNELLKSAPHAFCIFSSTHALKLWEPSGRETNKNTWGHFFQRVTGCRLLEEKSRNVFLENFVSEHRAHYKFFQISPTYIRQCAFSFDFLSVPLSWSWSFEGKEEKAGEQVLVTNGCFSSGQLLFREKCIMWLESGIPRLLPQPGQ